MDPLTLSLIGGGVSAVGSALGGLFGSRKPSKMQQKKQDLIDDLLASVKGQGSYNDLFNTSDEAFQKSFVDPAKARFRNQIAPQIQQEYIATGQQRGSGLEDKLARAGVDLDQMLNQYQMQYNQQKEGNVMNALNSYLGFQEDEGTSLGQSAMQGLGGYFAGGRFGKDIENVGNANSMNKLLEIFKNNKQSSGQPDTTGFTPT